MVIIDDRPYGMCALAEAVSKWVQERGLLISALKSHIILFTSHTHQSQYRPLFKLDDTPLPLKRHRKLIDVTFDLNSILNQHIKIVKEQTSKRLKVLKALTGKK